MAVRSGFLISIEGGEGAGKTTAMDAIRAVLAATGHEVVITREPGGTPAGERIRQLLLDPASALCAEAELLLMFASRAQLVREIIKPALDAGAVVVTDRFTDASFAYQGGGRGLPTAVVAELERWAVALRPDLTFLLDVGVEVGLARARARGEGLDRIEDQEIGFFTRVRDAYRERAATEPARFRLIDASQEQENVVAAVTDALQGWLACR